MGENLVRKVFLCKARLILVISLLPAILIVSCSFQASVIFSVEWDAQSHSHRHTEVLLAYSDEMLHLLDDLLKFLNICSQKASSH